MNENKHTHFSYNDIERYYNATEDDFTYDNLSFFENFEKQMETCAVCKKRFQAYAAFEMITEMEEPPLGVETAPVFTTLIDKIIKQLKEKIGEIGDVVYENLTVDIPAPMMARGLNIKIIANKTGFGFSEFELSGQESTEVEVHIPPQEKATHIYKLSIWNAQGVDSLEEATFMQTYELTENMDNSFSVITDKLESGKYTAVVLKSK